MNDTTLSPQTLRKNLIGGSVGNVLEWYDFAVFGYFAAVIGDQFFPNADSFAQLINTFGVFAAGYMMRPLGGMFFGSLGDRVGRKKALQLSVVLMMVPTVLVGCLPTYDMIGIAAPALLVLLRLLQGLSVGGELIGSISFLAEVAPKGKRAFYSSFSMFSAIAGIMLGSLLATVAHSVLNDAQMAAWGWRLPFLFGLVIGGYALWSRKHMIESPEFLETKKAGKLSQSPVKDALKIVPGKIFHTAALVSGLGGGFYMLFVWWPTYLTSILPNPISHALLANTICMVALMLFVPCAGALSDRLGPGKIYLFGAIALGVCSYPFFVMVDHGGFWVALTAQLVFAVFMAALQGSAPAIMVDMFPAQYRYSGIAIGYNITLAVVGGTTPLICTWLVHTTGDLAAPGYYLIVLSAVSAIAAAKLERPGQDSAAVS